MYGPAQAGAASRPPPLPTLPPLCTAGCFPKGSRFLQQPPSVLLPTGWTIPTTLNPHPYSGCVFTPPPQPPSQCGCHLAPVSQTNTLHTVSSTAHQHQQLGKRAQHAAELFRTLWHQTTQGTHPVFFGFVAHGTLAFIRLTHQQLLLSSSSSCCCHSTQHAVQ